MDYIKTFDVRRSNHQRYLGIYNSLEEKLATAAIAIIRELENTNVTEKKGRTILP